MCPALDGTNGKRNNELAEAPRYWARNERFINNRNAPSPVYTAGYSTGQFFYYSSYRSKVHLFKKPFKNVIQVLIFGVLG